MPFAAVPCDSTGSRADDEDYAFVVEGLVDGFFGQRPREGQAGMPQKRLQDQAKSVNEHETFLGLRRTQDIQEGLVERQV